MTVPLERQKNIADVAARVREQLGLGDSATLDVGTASGTVAAGDDARIVDALNKDYVRPDTTGAVSAPYVLRLKDMQLTLREMGYTSGNARAALSAALATGERIYLNNGVIPVDGDVDEVVNTPVYLEGSGFGASEIVFTGNTRGLLLTQDTYLNQIQIRNVALVTDQEEPGSALEISYSDTDSIGNRNVTRCLLGDVAIYGDDINTAGWLRGIVLNNVHRPDIIRPKITGRKNAFATGPDIYKNMLDGIKIYGDPTPTLSAVPSDILIDAPRIDHASVAISSSGEVEGLIVRDPVMVGVDKGVFADYATKRPWVSVRGGHIYSFTSAVDLTNAVQSVIDGVLIYKPIDANSDTNCVVLNGCDDTKIINLGLQNQAPGDASASGEFNGVVVQNSERCTISKIDHVNPSKTVILSGTTNDTRTETIRQFGSFSGATVQLYDDVSSGTNEFSQGNLAIANAANAGVVNLSDTTPAAVATTASFNVCKGERYLVTGNIEATKGGAAGQFLTQLSRVLGGGAAASWGSTGVTVTARNDCAASASIGQSVSGVLNITASGTVVIQLVATVTGSTATVAANASQLSVVAL